MKEDRKGPVGRGSPDIEGELCRLTPASIPPGLRRRVLDQALEARRNVALTPCLRALAIACAAMIIAILAIDPPVGRHETARLSALLDRREAAVPAIEVLPELAEALDGQEGETGWISRHQVLSASAARRERQGDLIEARARLKGWIEYEASEDPD